MMLMTSPSSRASMSSVRGTVTPLISSCPVPEPVATSPLVNSSGRSPTSPAVKVANLWLPKEYFADLPSLNIYRAKTGGEVVSFSDHAFFMDYLLQENVITFEQRRNYSRGLEVKASYDVLSIAIYKLLQIKGYRGMDEDLSLSRRDLDRLLYYLDESMLDSGKNRSSSLSSFDAASVLARFSTTNPAEGEARANAVSAIISQHKTRNPDSDRVLDLLHAIAPELSIEERREAADKLASISEDGQWDESETAEGVFYLASLITGDEPNPEERIEAAHEMVALYEAGDLNAETSLDLMDTIAPSLSINESDASDRIKEHRERKEKLETAAGEAREALSKRRVTLDRMETITDFARDMSEYLKTSELTESRAFIRSFVKEIAVRPGKATIHYTIPTPEDSPIEGEDAAEVVLNGEVMNMGVAGGVDGTRTAEKQSMGIAPPLWDRTDVCVEV